jgi:hypothetical protein
VASGFTADLTCHGRGEHMGALISSASTWRPRLAHTWQFGKPDLLIQQPCDVGLRSCSVSRRDWSGCEIPEVARLGVPMRTDRTSCRSGMGRMDCVSGANGWSQRPIPDSRQLRGHGPMCELRACLVERVPSN